MSLTRRNFLKGSAAVAASATLATPFRALADGAPRRRPFSPDYGPLQEVRDRSTGLPLLKLPKGFSYLSFGWTGDPMRGGGATPARHDAGAVFAGRRGRLYYVRNHELKGPSTSFAPAYLNFDGGEAPGGTTTVVFDGLFGRYIATRPSLGGTVNNCAGGPTPWGSWLSCEETVDDDVFGDGASLQEKHGWVFEVPVHGPTNPEPIRGMGRFRHEAVAVDPATGIVYETEDTPFSGFYRYVPNEPGNLRAGGALQMLKHKDVFGFDASQDVPINTPFEVEWVPIAEPEKAHAFGGVIPDGLGVVMQGVELGGTIFRRGEGIWYANGKLYFTCTTGGRAGFGQVFELDPASDVLTLLFDSPSQSVLNKPDNITVSPRGGVLLCEDGDGDQLFLRGLTADAEIFDFAENNVVLDGERNGIAGDFRDSEWAGAAFSPDGRWLFANIQSPGISFAITGPWRRGIL